MGTDGSRVVLVFAFAALASCGGGSGSDDGAEAAVSAEVAAPVPDETATAVGRNVEAYGDAGAFAVTVAALDRGYSVRQIIDGSPVGADGSIAATSPAGSSLGLLSVEVQGFAPARQDDELAGTLGLRLEFLMATLGEIHGVSSDKYEADARQAAEEAQEEFTDDHYHLAFAVLTLVGRGYTVEQAMQGVFFDEMSFETAVCVRLPEKPAGVAIPGASANCKPITTDLDEAAGPLSSVANGSEPVADDQTTQSEFDEDRQRAVYQATIGDLSALLGADAASVTSNLVSVDLDGDVPELALLWVAQLTGNYDNDSEVVCVVDGRLEVQRAELAGATLAGNQWTGQANIEATFSDGTCSAGSQNENTDTVTVTVTFTATDTTLTGTVNGALSFSFEGTSAS